MALSPDSTLNPYAAPKSRLEDVPASGVAWRDGRLVRLKREGALPDRCVVCNADAHGDRIARTLYYSPLAWRIGAFAAPFVAMWLGFALEVFVLALAFWPLVLVLFIAHFFVRKSMKLELGICARHRKLRSMLIGASLAGMAAILVGVYVMVQTTSGWNLLLGGAAALFVLAIAERFIGVQAVTLKKLSADDAWLGGTGKAFREALPEQPG